MSTDLQDDLLRYYEDRIAMMSTKAWKDLMEDVEKMREATNNVGAIQDEKTLHFKRGELSIMNWMLSLEEMSRIGYIQQMENKDANPA